MVLSFEGFAHEIDDQNSPLVSVVIPFYNQRDFVMDAVESVFAQGYPNLEVIVVDDGSTGDQLVSPGTWPNRITVIRQSNAGPAAARNRAIEASSGDIVAFLDSDDIWPSGKLAAQLLPLLVDDHVDIVVAKISKLTACGAGGASFAVVGNPFYSLQLGCIVMRKRVFVAVGLFDESLRYSEDQDWFLRAREEEVAIVRMDIVGLLYRSHEASLTRQDDRAKDFGLVRILKRSLNRRRASSIGGVSSLLSLGNLKEWRGGA